MLIWSGRGILIPVFAVLGVLVGSFAGGIPLLMLKADPGTYGKWTSVFSMVGVAAALWIFAKTIGKTQEQVLVDPRTRQPVLLTTKHTFFFLPSKFWSVVAGIFALSMVIMPAPEGGTPRGEVSGAATTAGVQAFRDADDLLVGRSKGIVHGNNPAAIAFAEAFSRMLEDARAAGVEKRSSNSIISLTKGDFLTYCLLTRQRCVFMVHVPDLRKFNSDAKDFISEAAWHIALKIIEEAGVTPSAVAVGIRGSLLYDRAIVGHPGPVDDAMSLIERTLQGNDDSRAELALMFDTVPIEEQPLAAVMPGKQEIRTTGSESVSAQQSAVPAKAVMQAQTTRESPSPASSNEGDASLDAPRPSSAPASAAPPSPSPSPSPSPAPAPTLASSMPAPDSPAATPSAARTPQPLAEMRDWKDTTGRGMRAAFVRFTTADQTSAEFKREDDKLFTIPLDRLSPGDQFFILRHPDLRKL